MAVYQAFTGVSLPALTPQALPSPSVKSLGVV